MANLNGNGSAAALQAFASAQALMTRAGTELTTGRKVNSARDDGAAFAISKSIQSKLIEQNAAAQGQARARSMLDVTQTSVDAIHDLLSQMREKALAASDTSLDTVSRNALVSELGTLSGQITSQAANASFNGINLLKNKTHSASVLPSASASTHLQGSLSFDSDGQTGSATLWFSPQSTVNSVHTIINWGDGNSVNTTGGSGINYTYAMGNTYAAPGTYNITYDITSDRPLEMSGIFQPDGLISDITSVPVYGDGTSLDISHKALDATTLGVADITTQSASQALASIDSATDTVTSAGLYFATRQTSVERMAAQTSRMIDAYDQSYGNMLDADMSKVSAQWQAAQTRAQLAGQALGIANAAPQALLQLFR